MSISQRGLPPPVSGQSEIHPFLREEASFIVFLNPLNTILEEARMRMGRFLSDLITRWKLLLRRSSSSNRLIMSCLLLPDPDLFQGHDVVADDDDAAADVQDDDTDDRFTQRLPTLHTSDLKPPPCHDTSPPLFPIQPIATMQCHMFSPAKDIVSDILKSLSWHESSLVSLGRPIVTMLHMSHGVSSQRYPASAENILKVSLFFHPPFFGVTSISPPCLDIICPH